MSPALTLRSRPETLRVCSLWSSRHDGKSCPLFFTVWRPEGWSASFAERVGDVVLPGYTAFSTRDANAAAVRLLARGSIRLKEPLGAGRFGQTHVTTLTELEAFLDVYPPDKLAGYGLVL